MYGTALLSRRDVLPGTLILHKGKQWLASANVEKGLYAIAGIEKIRITSENIEIVLTQSGHTQAN